MEEAKFGPTPLDKKGPLGYWGTLRTPVLDPNLCPMGPKCLSKPPQNLPNPTFKFVGEFTAFLDCWS